MIQDFKAIPKLCPLLIELHVENSDWIDYAIMSDLCQSLKELRLLNVDNCPQIIPADRVNLGVKHKGRIEFDPVHKPPVLTHASKKPSASQAVTKTKVPVPPLNFTSSSSRSSNQRVRSLFLLPLAKGRLGVRSSSFKDSA